MTRTENGCVDCQLPCIRSNCKYYRVQTVYCDSCDKKAGYRIDGEDYCEECAKAFLQEQFDGLSIVERAKALNIHIEKIE